MNIDHQKILDEVRANNVKIRSCARHEFLPPPAERSFANRRVTCSRCGGTADIINAMWYERGREHAETEERKHG